MVTSIQNGDEGREDVSRREERVAMVQVKMLPVGLPGGDETLSSERETI